MGRQSELLGRAFEQRVERQLADIPAWIKIPTSKTTKGGVWLDYVGCLPGGRMVTGDAKWRPDTPRITPGVLKPHQRVWAARAHEAGALVLVLVGWVDEAGEVAQAAIPWPAVVAGADRDTWRCVDLMTALMEMHHEH